MRQVTVDARDRENRAGLFKVATTILDASITGGQIGELYEQRWSGEVDIRALKSTPAPVAAAILTLALAIGTNAGMVGLVGRALLSGQVDLIAAMITVTPGRQEVVAFSEPTRKNVSEIVVNTGYQRIEI